MLHPRSFVNAFSLSRIGLAMLFVVCFQRQLFFLYVSVAVCVIALITDVLDGYIARRLKVASIHGRLIVREVALYITRVLFIEKLPKIERIRPWTNWHGYFMYLTIVLGLARMYADVRGLSFPVHPYMQVSAYAALACGVASIIHFLRLR
jgi:phosphatidylglycerophosphate synthase